MPHYRVLIVDDEPPVLRSTSKPLRYAGHAVETASNAEDAIALCQEHSFDVVVIDFMMPGVNGLELLARIRKVQPHVRSIIISGQLDPNASEEEITTQLRQAVEVDAYLKKPVLGSTIAKMISDLMSPEPPSDWQQIAIDLNKIGGLGTTKTRAAAKKLKQLKKRKRT